MISREFFFKNTQLYSLFWILDIKLFLTEIRGIKYEQRQMAIVLQKIQATLDNLVATDNAQLLPISESSEYKYDIQLLIVSYKQFIEFDKRLLEDKECQAAFVSIKI